MGGWRLALRIAARDVRRAKGRSALVVLLVMLPVLAVSFLATTIQTSQLDRLEQAQRDVGTAQAIVDFVGGTVAQTPDAGQWMSESEADDPGEVDPAQVREDVAEVLGADAVALQTESVTAPIDDRRVELMAIGVDLTDPLGAGQFDLREGRLPRDGSEVVGNDAVLDAGWSLGDTIAVDAAEPVTLVGVGRHPSLRSIPVLVGAPGSMVDASPQIFLVGGGDAVAWEHVTALNAKGYVVTAPSVIADPPPASEVSPEFASGDGSGTAVVVAALVATMALLEVVLLAGPAFAVTARQQSRTLALLAASGATPRQGRAVVLAVAVVLGLLATAVGVVAGVGLAAATMPLLQLLSPQWFGAVQVPWVALAVVAVCGLVSALLAAAVPAWLASRQDVVAVLAGRRGDPVPSRRSPVLGVVLFGVGMAGSAYGAVAANPDAAAVAMAGSAVIAVLGMVLVVPVVVALVSRLARRLPLVARYAARDAARHRTRTVPAVAAVAATVAGVVALGIANASDEKENRETYSASLAMDHGRVSWWPEGETSRQEAERGWERLAEAAATVVPAETITPVRGLPDTVPSGGYVNWRVAVDGDEQLLTSSSGFWGATVVVADTVDGLALGAEALASAEVALAAGRVVVFADEDRPGDEVVLTQEQWDVDDELESSKEYRMPAEVVAVDGESPLQAVVPSALAQQRGLDPSTVGLLIDGPVSRDDATELGEAVAAVEQWADSYVERGYERPASATIILLVLAGVGGVLVLGGTITATALAISDARPDLATLAAVGGSPRTRRGVAGAYALVIGVTGALLGVLVGAVPGVAVARTLTVADYGAGPHGPFLDVPWLMIGGVVVLVPLLAAVVVMVMTRARLPMVARID